MFRIMTGLRAAFVVATVVVLGASAPVLAAGDTAMALGFKAGTLGVGLDLLVGFNDNLGMRAGFATFPYSSDDTWSDVDYDYDYDLATFNLLLDWYPTGNNFRVTAGAMINNNEIDADAALAPGETYEIGGVEYPAEAIGSLNGKVTFDSVAPYLGIGVGNPLTASGRWRFQLDIGVMYQGEGDVSLTAENPLNIPDLDDQLAIEEAEVQEEVDDYEVYPVIQLGVSFRF